MVLVFDIFLCSHFYQLKKFERKKKKSPWNPLLSDVLFKKIIMMMTMMIEKEVKRRMIRSWAVFSPEGTKSGVGPRGGWGQANLETQNWRNIWETHFRNTVENTIWEIHKEIRSMESLRSGQPCLKPKQTFDSDRDEKIFANIENMKVSLAKLCLFSKLYSNCWIQHMDQFTQS